MTIRAAAEDRFWAKVRKGDGCWEWMGARTAPGWHGIFGADATRATRTMTLAHRYSWELHFGPIPDGLKVCHACDNAGCVRPDHLWLGTQRANMVDAGRKGRMGVGKLQTHCRNGHPFTDYRDSYSGRRRCVRCRNVARRRRYALADALRSAQ